MVGAGNGGRASAAHLALDHHRVALVDRFPEQLTDVIAHRSLTLSGALTGTASLDLVTDDVAAALERSELVLVSVPAFALQWVAEATAPYLRPDHVVVLHPGGTVGALLVRAVWDAYGVRAGTTLATTDSLIYACRLTTDGDPEIHAVKRRLRLAALPASATPAALAAMQALYPQVVAARDVLSVGFANLNPIIHPPIQILNAGRTDRGESFDFYGSGVTPGVARSIDALDRERLQVGGALGVDVEPLADWVQAVYGIEGHDTAEVLDRMSREIYHGIQSPTRLDSRYLTEDIPFGLVPLMEFAAALDIPAPEMVAMTRLASTILGRDLRSEGIDLRRVGLEGSSAHEMLASVA